MASRSVSPGGALLRASRVFSVPPPLPRPMGDLSSQAVFNSDTATLPHPVHQSITTPQASLARGDWGFKRPLPLRSTTKTSTPFIRVEAIDTFEHITEFGSAADHSLTLQKWQEMGVPLSTPIVDRNSGQFENGDLKSVFEADIDSIAESDGSVRGHEDTRWKFKGPWLAGQTEGDFNRYLLEDVRKRKNEFQKYLRRACANALTREIRQAATGEMPPAVNEKDITEEQFTDFVKTLRNTRSELYKLIRNFLDLPPAPTRKLEFTEEILKTMSLKAQPGGDLPISSSPYANTGPPKTHPSAGLAYSLTNAYTYNHPVFGPQKHQRPVQARVVMPKNSATGSFGTALGVGGFVTEVPAGSASFNLGSGRASNRDKKTTLPGLQNIEPEKVGGSKVWVHPSHARIDPKGRVILTVTEGDAAAIAVHEGKTDQIPVIPTPKLTSRFGVGGASGFGSSKPRSVDRGYGLDIDDSSRLDPPRPRQNPGRQHNPLSQLVDLM